MRTSFILLSAAVLLAACSNDAETTAPHTPISTTVSKKTDFPPGPGKADYPPGPGAPVNGASAGQNSKPQYFSTITIVHTPIASFDGVNMIALGVNAMCPAGSVVTGGGYEVTGQNAKVLYNGPLGTNGWRVYVWSNTGADFAAYAVCAQ